MAFHLRAPWTALLVAGMLLTGCGGATVAPKAAARSVHHHVRHTLTRVRGTVSALSPGRLAVRTTRGTTVTLVLTKHSRGRQQRTHLTLAAVKAGSRVLVLARPESHHPSVLRAAVFRLLS
ncbi:MAG: hypothetical protein OWV35_09700 [Firmicutes bacterium]|nr:hypothetical protein [Bacillota bacterium]